VSNLQRRVDRQDIFDHREQIRRRIVDVELAEGRIAAAIVETVDCENLRSVKGPRRRKMTTFGGEIRGTNRDAQIAETSRIRTVGD
jgi:hypothetical protein